jgi:hypothetical protein
MRLASCAPGGTLMEALRGALNVAPSSSERAE